MLLRILDGDPSEVGKFGDRRLTAEPSIAAGAHAAERHLRLVVHRRPIDMANAGINFTRNLERAVDILAEYGRGQTILRVICKLDGMTRSRDETTRSGLLLQSFLRAPPGSL